MEEVKILVTFFFQVLLSIAAMVGAAAVFSYVDGRLFDEDKE